MVDSGRGRWRAPLEADGRLEKWALRALYALTAAAVVGYATYGLNPSMLARTPSAVAVYSEAFVVFPRAHILVGFIALAVALYRRAAWRWVGAFAALYAISLGAELLGTTSGLPFGAYRYTEALGPRWLGHVPALIPMSWFTMAVPSYALATHWLRGGGPLSRILIGSLVLLSWDLVLDPAMSRLVPYWVWGTEGSFYGMPLLNLVGWYVTGLALMAALVALRAERWIADIPLRTSGAIYGANLVLPMGMCIAAGIGGAAAASVATLVLCIGLARVAVRVRPGRFVRADVGVA